MASSRTLDETHLLADATRLFQERGYAAVTVPDLTERLGICRQSLHSRFGDKRGLYLRALETWSEREIEPQLGVLAQDGSPLENLRAVIRSLGEHAIGCPGEACLTVAALVDARDDPAALAVVGEQVDRLEHGFLEALDRALVAGELRPDARPTRLAGALLATCQGIGVLARLPGSRERIADAVSVMLGLIDDAAV